MKEIILPSLKGRKLTLKNKLLTASVAVALTVLTAVAQADVPAAEKLCVVDDIVLAEDSRIRAGGSGSLQVDVENEGTIHDALVTNGNLNFKGPVVYHPYKELKFYCQPNEFRGVIVGCDPKVATYGQIDYETEEYYQWGFMATIPWYHPPMTVQRNGDPQIMTTDAGLQYSVLHFRAPQMLRDFRSEPTFFNGKPAMSAVLSTASRIETTTGIAQSLGIGPFTVDLPKLDWLNAGVTNSAGAKITCKLAELTPPPADWLCSECINLGGQRKDGAPVWTNGGGCESDWEMRNSGGNACAAGDANCFYYCPDPPEGATSSSRCAARYGLGDCSGGGTAP